ncbi:MAG: NifU family protein [Gammaproteobacteria bacterium]|jgi:Fe/S biogenesis protein NfuA|nr:NifU family protein [Gammaproteobacteria bacterium]
MSVDAVTLPKILITESAQEHFHHLITKEEMPGMGLRLFLDHPGLPNADVSISFCPPGEHRGGDIVVPFEKFTLYIDRASVSYLEDAEIDYKSDKLGGQLAITAPNLKGAKPNEDDSLAEKVNYILHTEVNPNLASHGGMVTLVEITPMKEVVLRFGGGCHGCGMVDVTLKQGIEKSLMTQLPEITAVIDVTDHTQGENPYYAS